MPHPPSLPPSTAPQTPTFDPSSDLPNPPISPADRPGFKGCRAPCGWFRGSCLPRGKALTHQPLAGAGAWLVSLLVGALVLMPLQDYDLFWHLAIGRDLAQGGWPWVDTFSWTARGQRLSFVPWLPSLAFYGVWLGTGYTGLVALQGAVCALWAGLSLRFLRHLGTPAIWGLLFLPLCFLLLYERFLLLRSHLIPYLWLPWAAVLTWRLRGDPSSRWKWAFVPWMALWVQSHASFALGFAWLGLTLVWPKLASPDLRRRFWKEDTLVLLACLGVCFFTPSGAGIFAFLSQHVKGGEAAIPGFSAIFRLTAEALPLPLSDLFAAKAPYLMLALLGLPGVILLPWRQWGGEKLVWLVLLFLPFRQQRFLGEFALFSFLFLPAWWAELQRLSQTRKATEGEDSGSPETSAVGEGEPRASRVEEQGGHREGEPRADRIEEARVGLGRLARVGVVGGLLGIGLSLGLMSRSFSWREQLSGLGFGVLERSFPANSVKFLRDHKLQGKLYNSRESGGYLIWKLPDLPVSMDGRTLILYSDRLFYERVGRFYLSMDSFPDTLDAWGVTMALVRNDRFSAALHDSRRWQAVSIDAVVTLYLRWGKGYDDLLKRYGYYYLPKVHRNHPSAAMQALHEVAAEPDALLLLKREIQRAQSQSLYPSPRLSWLQRLLASNSTP